ncbi:MAG: hypothetical protein AAF328_08600 [Planctomycetota bacterium]
MKQECGEKRENASRITGGAVFAVDTQVLYRIIRHPSITGVPAWMPNRR